MAKQAHVTAAGDKTALIVPLENEPQSLASFRAHHILNVALPFCRDSLKDRQAFAAWVVRGGR